MNNKRVVEVLEGHVRLNSVIDSWRIPPFLDKIDLSQHLLLYGLLRHTLTEGTFVDVSLQPQFLTKSIR